MEGVDGAVFADLRMGHSDVASVVFGEGADKANGLAGADGDDPGAVALDLRRGAAAFAFGVDQISVAASVRLSRRRTT